MVARHEQLLVLTHVETPYSRSIIVPGIFVAITDNISTKWCDNKPFYVKNKPLGGNRGYAVMCSSL